MIIDTESASIDIVDETAFKHINQDNITLQPSSKLFTLAGYGSKTKLMSEDRFDKVTIFFPESNVTQCYMYDGSHGSLLSYKTATTLGILHLHVSHHMTAQSVLPTVDHCLRSTPVCSNGIGKLKGVEVKLHIDETIATCRSTTKKDPFSHPKESRNRAGQPGEKGHHWACVWSYTLGLTTCNHPKEKRRNSYLCRHAGSESSHHKRTAPTTNSRWSHTHSEWSYCVFKARPQIRLSSSTTGPREPIYHYVCDTPRSLEIHSIEFWHQFGQWDVSKDNTGPTTRNYRYPQHQRWCHCLWKDPSRTRQSAWCCLPEVCREQCNTQQEVRVQ